MRTCVAALLGLVMSAGTAAAQCTVPNTLTNNTNADATQVMANFNALATCINNISPTSAPAGTIAPFAGMILPNGWLWANGAAVSRTTYAALWAALGKSDTVTISIASPAVVTWTSGAHGLANDWPVKLYSTGALPTGLTAGQIYYVKSATTNTFRLALAPGGADINTSGSQSGTQTGVFAPYGNGDNATTFNLPDLRGRAPFGLDNLGGATAAGVLPVNGTYAKGTSPGAVGGEQAHSLTIAEMPSHNHAVGVGANLAPGINSRAASGDGTSFGYFYTEYTGGSVPHNTLPPLLMTNYIIKH